MGRSEVGRGGLGWRVCVAALALWGSSVVAGSDNEMTGARLSRAAERFAVDRAIGVAIRWLAHPECERLIDEFADATGRPLRSALNDSSVGDYASRVLFYDAPPAKCRDSRLALTAPGSRVVLVCGARFLQAVTENPRHAEAIVVHEVLHSLGLGENPPTSEQITKRVLSRCGR